MEDIVTTSEMRVAVCAAICSTVIHADAPTKQRLASDLDALPFERMSDRALIEVGYRYMDRGYVDTLVASRSAVRYEITRLVLCPVCLDERFIEVEPGRYGRCDRCNIAPEPAEPKGHR